MRISRRGIFAKWLSDEISVAPASMAQAAIHISFCGIGVPFALSVLKIRAYALETSSVTGIMSTDGESRNASNTSI